MSLHTPFVMVRHPNLVELGERLAAKFAEISKRPSAYRCDYLLDELTQARNAIADMRTRLLRGELPSA